MKNIANYILISRIIMEIALLISKTYTKKEKYVKISFEK